MPTHEQIFDNSANLPPKMEANKCVNALTILFYYAPPEFWINTLNEMRTAWITAPETKIYPKKMVRAKSEAIDSLIKYLFLQIQNQ